MPMTPYEELLSYMDSLSGTLHPHEAKDIIKRFLAGRRVFCSNVQRHAGHIEADKLVKGGMSKPDAISALMQRKGFSRQWATVLVNGAIDRKYKEQVTKNTERVSGLKVTHSYSIGGYSYD